MRNLNSDIKAYEVISVLFFLSTSWWLDALQNDRENYPRKCFWTKEIETRVKFNPGLSANRPSNNWAQKSILQEWSRKSFSVSITGLNILKVILYYMYFFLASFGTHKNGHTLDLIDPLFPVIIFCACWTFFNDPSTVIAIYFKCTCTLYAL